MRVFFAIILAAAGAFAGWRLAPVVARVHFVVRQAEQVRLEAEDPKLSPTLESNSFREWGMTKEDLYAHANAVLARFRVLTPVAGALLGLAIALVATGVGGERRRNIYEIDYAACVSCGRCFAICPIEQKRRRQMSGSLAPKPPADPEARRPERTFLIAVMVLAGMFSGAVAGVMVATQREDQRAEFPESPVVADIEEMLKKDPANEQLKSAAREEDTRYREQSELRRRRIEVGRWMLLVSLAVLAVAARLYLVTMPAPTPKRPAANGAPAGTGRGKQVTLVLMLLLAAGILYGIFGPPAVKDFAITAPPPAVVYHDNWPSFRGDGMGVVPADNYPVEWDNGSLNIAWKTEIPLPGKSSPVVWGARVFVTGADNGSQQIYCFDRTDGRLLWKADVRSPETVKRVAKGPASEFTVFEDTTWAAPTPVTDGKRVYALFASADLAAAGFDGTVQWVRNFGAPQSNYGLTASLAFVDNTLIFQFDQGGSAEDNLSAIYGLDPASGSTVWRTPRGVSATWCSPVVAKTPKGPLIIASGTPYVAAYDPSNGAELWKCMGMGADLAPSPVWADGKVYATGDGGKVLAIRPGGEGDVTATHVAWSQEIGMSDAPSPLATAKWFFQVTSGGSGTCFSADNGTLLWRHGFRASVWSSPTLVGDVVYLADEDGKTHLFRTWPKFEEVRANPLGEAVYGSPAFVDGQIIFRGAKHLICVAAKK